MMITKKMLENAHKITYLVTQYPKHTMPEIIALLQMPAIDINTAFWAAQDMDYIAEPTKDGSLVLKYPPEVYDFGETVPELKEALLYCFTMLAKEEVDLEENYLSQWVTGYTTQDVTVAMKLLLNERKLAEYTISDGENNYTFYTLFENLEQEWGRKQFKKPPKIKKGKK